MAFLILNYFHSQDKNSQLQLLDNQRHLPLIPPHHQRRLRTAWTARMIAKTPASNQTIAYAMKPKLASKNFCRQLL
tara:strand:- start:351 stop:578 length:228 start_codon:yes stop_codon:yes gene_type:complete